MASESGGAYDPGSTADDGDALGGLLDDLLDLVDEQERLRRRMLDRWGDVHAHGGLAAATGWTAEEWLRIVAGLAPREVRTLTSLTTRLPGLPDTAEALRTGAITVDQASTIVAATSGLSGLHLAEVDAELARLAADRLARGDDLDVRVDAERAVARRRPSKDGQRRERRQLDGERLVAQSDLDGGGWVYAEYGPEGFATVVTAVERAAGPPHPDEPRGRQRAVGLHAMARHWLGGRDAIPTPADGTVDDTAGPRPATAARPTVTVLVDIADATSSSFGELLRVSGRFAPRISARLAETLACDAPLLVRLTEGANPLAELAGATGLPTRLRQAVLERDRGCRWPGCTAPAWQVDVEPKVRHHIVHRQHGGDHHASNLVGLCRRHHVRLHGRFWTATLDPDTAAFSLSRRRDGTDPIHTTYPSHRPPEVALPG